MSASVRSAKPAAKRAPRAPKPAVAGSVKSAATIDREISAAHYLAASRKEALRRFATKLEADSLGAQRQAYFVRHPDARYASRGAVNSWVSRVCAAAGIACRYDDMDALIPE